MLTLAIPAWNILLRTIVVYLILLIGLRLPGKREIGQMNVFDLVVLLLIANAVQNAMVGSDTSFIVGVIAAVAILTLNTIVARLRLRWPVLRHLVEGTPTLLVLHGEIIQQHLEHEGLDQGSLEAALREHGISKLSDVEMAVLEIDGTISVVPAEANTNRVKNPMKFLRHQ